MKPPVCIIRTEGTNCDQETAWAFQKCGADPQLVHINQLRNGQKNLEDYAALVIPGGFSYGDDVHSGKILAVEMTSFLKDALQNFVASKKPILGICNGFQVLVRTGLLPYTEIGHITSTLMANDSGRFECRWIRMRVSGNSIFTQGIEGEIVNYQVAHGEGKFFAPDTTLQHIEDKDQVVFRYVDQGDKPTQQYPANPNGSLNAIAGIADPSGLVLGLMPHPERFVEVSQHPNWRRGLKREPDGIAVFQNAVRYVRNM